MERAEGFERERLSVVPRPLVDAALTRLVTRRMLVTDAGYFPRARHHGRHRPGGAAETIVIVCVAGSGWVEAEGIRTRVGSSTAIVIPGGVAHSYGADATDPWTIWWCHVRGTDVLELIEAAGIRPDRLTLSLRQVERVTALLDEISVSLALQPAPARLVATSGMAWRLFTQLVVDRALPSEGAPVERAMRYLEERVDGRVQVAELAAMVGALKMARARALLDTTDLPVAEVGRRIGLDDPFYFSRQFRRTHGMSPRAYREQHKG